MQSYSLFVLCGCFAAIILNTTAYDTAVDTQDHKQPKVHVFEGVVRFKIHKSDLTKTHQNQCTESPEFELHYVTWKIHACKKYTYGSNGETYHLVVTIESIFSGKTEEWSCEAEADFKLLPKDSSYNAAHMRFGYFNFDRVHPSPNERSLVGWNSLEARYMIDDIATMEVRILAKPPNRIPGIQHASTKFQMRISNVKTLDELYSEEISVRGMRWKVLAMKWNEYFGVFVIVNEDDMDLDYSWNVTATFQLISVDADKSVERTFSNIQFDWTTTNYGFSKYIQWTDLMDANKKFVVGNTALLQIELSVAKPKPNPIA